METNGVVTMHGFRLAPELRPRGLSDGEWRGVIATCLANKMSPTFDGTYPPPEGERTAGYKSPPPPGGDKES